MQSQKQSYSMPYLLETASQMTVLAMPVYIRFYITELVDVWHRDTGPIFLIDNKGNMAVTDWNFNGWGTYPEWGNAECHIAQTVAKITDVPVFMAPWSPKVVQLK